MACECNDAAAIVLWTTGGAVVESNTLSIYNCNRVLTRLLSEAVVLGKISTGHSAFDNEAKHTRMAARVDGRR